MSTSTTRRVGVVASLSALLAVGSGHGVAQALLPPGVPVAACHDLAITFQDVTPQSFVAVISATVTRTGVFQLGEGHAYFGSSQAGVLPPEGTPMSTTQRSQARPGTDVTVRASCEGDAAVATVHVPDLPPVELPLLPQVDILGGPTRFAASGPHGHSNPVRAVAVDYLGQALAVTCLPRVLAVTPHHSTVTCTSAPDAFGRVAQARQEITIVPPETTLALVRRQLPPGPWTAIGARALQAIRTGDRAAQTRELALLRDAVLSHPLDPVLRTRVREAVALCRQGLGVRSVALHTVLPGEHLWQIARRLAPAGASDVVVHDVVKALLARNPGALDSRGLLRVGSVLDLTT